MSSSEIHHRHHTTKQLYRLFDLLGVFVSLLLAMGFYGIPLNAQYVLAGTAAMLFYLLISEATNIYTIEPGRAMKRRIGLVLVATFFTFIFLLVLAYVTKTTGTY
ncbi:hypothetical protein [sulfur-oxidizing endosymbiont of Gigantopelta aegis]|uniref:hypothetical protein n=1 Tax=sulfur-oxidizing endosymbiont of Gigantopelta aegis TaxID=2794934 RepID=UPI0018DC4394|nr:hypothetical protein [sulfur-oxidizing endosymbiont of Gigantopelta aegis]